MANFYPLYKHGEQVIHYCKLCGDKTQWRSGFQSSYISCISCGAPLSTDTLMNTNCLQPETKYAPAHSSNEDIGSSSSDSMTIGDYFTLAVIFGIGWVIYQVYLTFQTGIDAFANFVNWKAVFICFIIFLAIYIPYKIIKTVIGWFR